MMMSNASNQLAKRSIMIDTTFLFDQYGIRGIGRYGKEVIKRLIPEITQDGGWDIHFIGFHDLQKTLVEIGVSNISIDAYKDIIHFHSLGAPVNSDTKNYKRWYQDFQPIIDTVRPSVYFAMHFERGLPSLTHKDKKIHYVPKTVVAVHDAIPFQTQVFSTKSPVHNYLKKRFFLKLWDGVKNADLIVTASQYSKDKISKLGKVNEEIIKTIYLGVDKKFYRESDVYDEQDVPSILSLFNVKKDGYLFYDSGIEANKGIFELIDTLEYLFGYKRIKMEKKIVMVGGHFSRGTGKTIVANNKDAKRVLQYAKKKNVLEFIQTTGRIPDNELIILLHNAKAHINLSKLEGFNLGPIQAMAAEVPSILANASCNPEVSKEKSLLVDITKPKQTAKEIKQFIEDPKRVKKQVEEGLKVAQSYTWDATVDTIWENIIKL